MFYYGHIHPDWVLSIFCLGMFFVGSFLPAIITKDKSYLYQTWFVPVAWFCVALYIVLHNGEFANTHVGVSVVIIAGINSLLFMFLRNDTLKEASLNWGNKKILLKKKGEKQNEESVDKR